MRYFKYIAFLFFVSIFGNTAFAGLPETQDTVDCRHTVNLDWALTVGSDTVDAALSVCTDASGNIYAVGYFYHTFIAGSFNLISQGGSDMFLMKISPQGEVLWAERGGGDSNDKASGVVCDSEGNVYVVGTILGTVTFGGTEYFSYGEKDVFISQYNSDGDLLWLEVAGGWNNDEATGITIDADDNISIVGFYDGAMGIGSQTLVSNGGVDFFVAQFDANHNFNWAGNQGSNLDDYASSITADLDGNLFVGGTFSGEMTAGGFSMTAHGTNDGFIASYNQLGDIQWMIREGSENDNDVLNDITSDALGNVISTGYLDQNDSTLFVAKYNSNGNLQWRKELGLNAHAEGLGIVASNNGDIYVSGKFSGAANFGGGMTGSLGGFDLVLLKLNAAGDFIWSRTAGSGESDAINDICLDYEQSIISVGWCNAPIYIEGSPYSVQGESDALIIRFKRAISMDVNISGIDCMEDNLCVGINMLAGTTPFHYYWSTGDNVNYVCGLNIGSYSITVTDGAGCYIDTTFTLEAPAVPMIDLPANLEICPFDTVELNAGTGMTSYLWSNGEESESIFVTGPGVYSVTVFNDFGCENSASVNVTELDTPNLLLNETEEICQGDTIEVSVISSYNSYAWSNGASSQTVELFNQGSYSLTVNDAICVYYDTINIVFYPQPNVDLGNDQYLCDGSSIVFDAGDGFAQYLWQNGSSQQTYTLNSQATVMVTVTDVNDCTDSDTVVITQSENPELNLGNDTAICAYNEMVLNAGEDYESYLWSTGSSSQNITLDAGGTYSLTVSNEYGCTTSDFIIVELWPVPEIDLGDDLEFCSTSSEILSVEGEFPVYNWSNNSNTPTISVNESNNYSLTVTNTYACTGSDNINVLVHDALTPDLGETIIVCDSSNVYLQPETSFNNYHWSTGAETESIVVNNSGVYSLTVTDENSCTSSDNVEVMYVESPVISELYSSAGQIIVEATGGNSPYLFSLDGEHWQHGTTFINLNDDVYQVSVRDSLMCSDTISMYVDNLLNIPDFFTPNADGFNDTWEIGGMYQYPNSDIIIFDRYGKKLSEYKGGQHGWDGTYAGQIVPSDTYWYVIKIDKTTIIKGPVTVVR